MRELDFHAIGKPENFEKAMKYFTEMEEVIDVIATGKLKTTVKLFNNMKYTLLIWSMNGYLLLMSNMMN